MSEEQRDEQAQSGLTVPSQPRPQQIVSDPQSGRRSFTFNGRRVRIADLLAAGLVKPGDTLSYYRRRRGETHRAEITESGTLRCGTEEFSAPSAAAGYFSGGSIDGWTAWRHDRSEQLLDSLRQQLLDEDLKVESPKITPGPQGDKASIEDIDSTSSISHRQFLRDSRHEAEEGKPREIAVSEILRLWGVEKRTAESLHPLEADLGNYGLSTSPDIRYVPMQSSVKLVLQSSVAGEEEDQDNPPSPHAAFALEREEEEDGGEEIAQTVGQIASELTDNGRIAPTAPLDEAITKMVLNDFSQLAVMEGPRNLKGAITWQSIVIASRKGTITTARDAMIKNPTITPYERHLVEAIPELARSGFFFVRYDDNTYRIITTADVANKYGEFATPFLLIGELDQELRRRIKIAIDFSDAKELCDPKGERNIASFDDLAFGDYEMICMNPKLWETLGWPLDRKTFGARLAEIREFRNDVMHFNPDSADKDYILMIKNILSAIRI